MFVRFKSVKKQDERESVNQIDDAVSHGVEMQM